MTSCARCSTAALRAGRYVLENMGLTEYEAAEMERLFYDHDRETVQQLAELWDPMVPPSQNKAYVERTKELHRELEAALVRQSDKNAEVG